MQHPFLLLLVLLFSACSPTPINNKNALPLAMNSEIKQGVLKNGLHYLILPNSKPANKAQLRLVFEIGALEEIERERGLAHFIEHMAFNGTTKFPKNSVVSFMESIGMRFGSHVNASTGYAQTIYKLSVPTEDKKILAQTFDVLRDWSDGITFDSQEIEKERGVVIEEWRKRKTVRSRVNDQVRELIFKDSAYLNRKPIGLVSVLKTAPKSDFKHFYNQWYRPEFATLIVVGDVNTQEIESLIQTKFDSFKATTPFLAKTNRDFPDINHTRFKMITDPELTSSSVDFDFITPAFSINNQQDFKNHLYKQLAITILNERLSAFNEQENPPFLRSSANISQFTSAKTAFGTSTTFEPKYFMQAYRAMLSELHRIEVHGFLPTELARAKSKLLKRSQKRANEAKNLQHGYFTSQLLRHVLYKTPLLSPTQSYSLLNEVVPNIIPSDLHQAFKELLSIKNLVVTVTTADSNKAFIPTKDTLLQTKQAIFSSSITPHSEKTSKSITPHIDKIGKIIKKTQFHHPDFIHYQLSNGIDVLMKPTNFKKDEIMMYGFHHNGLNEFDNEHFRAASLLNNVLLKSGVATLSKSELQKIDANNTFSLQSYSGEIQAGYSGKCNQDEFNAFLERLHLMITQPRIDTKVLNNYKNRIALSIKERKNNPSLLFTDERNHFLYNNHPRKKTWTQKMLDSVTGDVLEELSQNQKSLPNESSFVFVGNVNADTFEKQICKYIATLPVQKKAVIHDPHTALTTDSTEFVRAYNSEPRSEVTLYYHQDRPYNREEYLDLIALTQLVNVRLREEVREKIGAVYGVGLRSSHVRLPNEHYLGKITFSCEPSRVDEILLKIDEVLTSLMQKPVNQSYIDAIKKIRHSKHDDAIKTNQFWLNILSKKRFYNDDYHEIESYKAWIDTITPKRLQKAANNYFKSATKITTILNPKEPSNDRH
jgi:zinc protease